MKSKFYLPVFIFLFLFNSCKNKDEVNPLPSSDASSVVESSNYGDIGVVEAQKLISTLADEMVIIDVRTPDEVSQGKINNARVLDYNDPTFDNKLAYLDKNKTYLMYCMSGGRSSGALEKMNALGINKVYNLKGGYRAWSTEAK